MAKAISYLMNICDFSTFNTIKSAIKKAGLLVEFSYNLNDFVNYMKKDKKNDLLIVLKIGDFLNGKTQQKRDY